ncbi:hypothetical protein KC324_g46 [Hortaea werneckii]|nr:hypothetical protein KC324_g46 [Hortaea werneckii]
MLSRAQHRRFLLKQRRLSTRNVAPIDTLPVTLLGRLLSLVALLGSRPALQNLLRVHSREARVDVSIRGNDSADVLELISHVGTLLLVLGHRSEETNVEESDIGGIPGNPCHWPLPAQKIAFLGRFLTCLVNSFTSTLLSLSSAQLTFCPSPRSFSTNIDFLAVSFTTTLSLRVLLSVGSGFSLTTTDVVTDHDLCIDRLMKNAAAANKIPIDGIRSYDGNPKMPLDKSCQVLC